VVSSSGGRTPVEARPLIPAIVVGAEDSVVPSVGVGVATTPDRAESTLLNIGTMAGVAVGEAAGAVEAAASEYKTPDVTLSAAGGSALAVAIMEAAAAEPYVVTTPPGAKRMPLTDAAAGASLAAVISLVDGVVGWTIILGAAPEAAAAGVSKALEGRYGSTDSLATVAEGLEAVAVVAGVVAASAVFA
jgi:hypothetical protein